MTKWKLSLQRAISRKRLGHALLLVSEDVGARKEAASYFAKILLCRNQVTKETILPCEKCGDCTDISLNKHLNVEWIGDAKEGIRIEQIRELREQLRLRAFSNKPRLIIIDNASAMTTGAANALLKSLEEPSVNQYFLLLAPSRFALLRTIASRCQTLAVKSSAFVQREDQDELSRFASGVISRIRQGDTAARSTLVDEIMKNSEDKSELLLSIQRHLHKELRVKNSEASARNEIMKSIDATELSRTFLERNTNAQLTLENWLLNLWPSASK